VHAQAVDESATTPDAQTNWLASNDTSSTTSVTVRVYDTETGTQHKQIAVRAGVQVG
jgi:hypothetical protein